MTKTCTFVVFLCGALLGLVLLILTNNNSPNTNAFLFGSCEHAVVNVTSTMNFFEYKTRSTAVRYIVTHSLDQKDVIMSTNQKNVSVQAVLTFVDAAYTIHEGTPHLYPFDKYRVFLTFDIYGSNVTLNTIFIQLSSSLDGWNADAYSISNVPFISPSINGVSMLIPVTLTRSSTQIVFCLFLYLIMWILSFHAFSMSITIYKSSKEVEAPTIGVVGGLLFALPAIRNSQPGTPTIGCIGDIVGYFLNMTLVGAGMIMLMSKYTRKFQLLNNNKSSNGNPNEKLDIVYIDVHPSP